MSGHGGSRREDDELLERFPHYKTYKACQSKAFMTGSLALIAVTATSYLALEHCHQKFKPPIGRHSLLAGSLMIGIAASYFVTQNRTLDCQNMWMAMEERHSVLTSASERLSMRLKEDQE